MEKRTLPLVSPTHRKFAASWCLEAPDGWTVSFRPARRSDEQSRKMHAMARDLSKQVPWNGEHLTTEQWKRFATAKLKKDRIIMSCDEFGQPTPDELISLAAYTRDMSAATIGLIISWFQWFGAQHGVVWANETRDQVEALGR